MKLICSLWVFVIITPLFFNLEAYAKDYKIGREIVGIKLGMTIQDVSHIYKIKQKEEGIVALMRKLDFGDPERLANINKLLDKKVFLLTGNLPKGIESIETFFCKGILYQIALHYSKDYVQKIDWDLFTLPAFKKYGMPSVNNAIDTLSSFSYQWIDNQTKLEIEKSGTLSNDKNRFAVTIYNIFYTDLATYDYLQKEEKKIDEKDSIAPVY